MSYEPTPLPRAFTAGLTRRQLREFRDTARQAAAIAEELSALDSDALRQACSQVITPLLPIDRRHPETPSLDWSGLTLTSDF